MKATLSPSNGTWSSEPALSKYRLVAAGGPAVPSAAIPAPAVKPNAGEAALASPALIKPPFSVVVSKPTSNPP
jgi:hypothetical protein